MIEFTKNGNAKRAIKSFFRVSILELVTILMSSWFIAFCDIPPIEGLGDVSGFIHNLFINFALIMIGIQFIIVIISLIEDQTHYFYDRRIRNVEKIALNSTNQMKLLQISREYESEYDIVCLLLRNKNLSSEIIDYWIFKGAWHYGLITKSCYGPIDVNLRLKLLELCVKNENVSSVSLKKLVNKIMESKDYYIEKCYPKDDYSLINELLENKKLSYDLKKQLNEYLKKRKNNEKSNPYCDENGFAYSVSELIDNLKRKNVKNATQ